MRVKIRHLPDLLAGLVNVPIAKATTVEVGDLISYESNKAVLLDAEAEDATFLGVSTERSTADDSKDLVVATKAVVEVTVTSAAYTIGQGIALNAGGTAFEGATDNILFWSLTESGGASVTTILALVDVKHLGQLFAVSVAAG